ncbi:hypothetical protein EDD18DRAFT_77267 [Armillaria luteobubalina]|uniref:Uncharacterized protein n=1 Tax=Armillaria luteobubalina TaxID=153913 RepID=A0AA39Q890_9AGAR|nr:hypothetical protein EDD18DRAFT_77267 [Armillaria luteobubalina]
MIVAISHLLYDSYPGATANPNLNPICGKELVATYGGKSVTVTVTDKCMRYAGKYDLDFTPTTFSRLASTDVGRLARVDWKWASRDDEDIELRECTCFACSPYTCQLNLL